MFSRIMHFVELSQQRADEGHLPLRRQLAEMLVLQLRYAIGPGFYHTARLWRRDISFRDKTRYLVGHRYLKAVAKINNPAYHKLSQHKVAEKALLTMFSIPTAEFLGYYHPYGGRTADGSPLTDAGEFLALAEKRALPAMAIKMPEGSCSTGFDIIDMTGIHDGRIFSRALNREINAADYLAAKYREYREQGIVMEAVIRQHPGMTALNASSVNTVRMWVRQSGTDVRVKSAVLKIGHPESLADTSTTGGLVVPVRLSDGVPGEPHFRPPPAGEVIGERFDRRLLEDFTLPCWQECLELARSCLPLFPNLDFAGMDIAITADGPLVVELNVQPDCRHAARVGIPTADLLSS
jgi:hypothetical protein